MNAKAILQKNFSSTSLCLRTNKERAEYEERIIDEDIIIAHDPHGWFELTSGEDPHISQQIVFSRANLGFVSVLSNWKI